MTKFLHRLLSLVAMIVLHDDAVREYAYGPAQGLPDSRVGNFPQTLYDEAQKNGWIVISMKNDWKQIFSFEPPKWSFHSVPPQRAIAARRHHP